MIEFNWIKNYLNSFMILGLNSWVHDIALLWLKIIEMFQQCTLKKSLLDKMA